MKNKHTARLSIVMCLVLIISTFAACSIKKDDGTTTTLAQGDSWQNGSGYEKVTISQAELVDLVGEALGDEMPENFKGDLSTLTPEQLNKVESFAKDEGYTVEKDENGDTVIKEEVIPTTEASKDEIKDLFNKVSVKDPSNLSDEEKEELSKVAEDEGLIVETKPNGDINIVKPVTTTRIVPRPTSAVITKREDPKTTKDNTPKTTSVYKPPQHKPVPTIAEPTPDVVGLADGWMTNYGSSGTHAVFSASAATDDGGVVCVGMTASVAGGSPNSALIVKYDENGKVKWTETIKPQTDGGKGSESVVVSFDGVTVLKDGSIIAVGSTNSNGIASPDEYKCAGTLEGLMVKYSAKGDKKWVKLLGGSQSDMLYAVEATADGGFVVGGKSTSSDGDFSGQGSGRIRAFVYKCNESGSVSWKTAYSGASHSAVVDIAVNPSGEIFATMENNSKDGDFANISGCEIGHRHGLVAKISSSGSKQWTKAIYETAPVNVTGVEYTDDGGCIAVGFYTYSAKDGNKYSFKSVYNGGKGGTTDGFAMKYKADGSIAWICPLIGFEGDFVSDIVKVENGYALAGYSASSNRDFQGLGKGNFDSYIYMLSQYGGLEKLYTYGGSEADRISSISSNGKQIYACGYTNSSDGSFAGISPAATKDAAAANIRCYKFA